MAAERPSKTPPIDKQMMDNPTPVWEQIGALMAKSVDGIKNGLNKLLNNTEFKETDVKNFIENNLVDSFGIAFTFVQIGNNQDGTRRWMPKAMATPIPGMSTAELDRKVNEINQLFEDTLKPNVATGIDNPRDPNRFTLLFIDNLGKAKPREVPKFTGTESDRHALLILARNKRLQNIFLKKGPKGEPISPDSMTLQDFSDGMQHWDSKIPLDGYTQTLLNAQAVFKNADPQHGASANEQKIHEALNSSSKDRLKYHSELLKSYDGELLKSYDEKTKKDLEDLKKAITTDLGIDASELNGAFGADEHILMKSGKDLMNSDTPAQDILDRLGKGVKNMNALEFAGLLLGSVYMFFTDDGHFKKGLMGLGAALVLAKPASSLLLNQPMGISQSIDTLYGDTKQTAAKYMKNISGYVSSLPGPLREFFQKNPDFVNGMQVMSHLEIQDMEAIVMGTAGADSFEHTVTILEKKLSSTGLKRHQIESWMKQIGFGDGERTRAFLEEIVLGAANVGHIPRENMTTEQRTNYLRKGFEALKSDYGHQESVVSVMIMQSAKGELRNFQITLSERLEATDGTTTQATTEGTTSTPTQAPETGTTPSSTPRSQSAPPEQTASPNATPEQSFNNAGEAATPAERAAAAAGASSITSARSRERASGYSEGTPHRLPVTLDSIRSNLARDQKSQLYLGEHVVDTSNTVVVGDKRLPVFRINGAYYGDVQTPTSGKLSIDGTSQTVKPIEEFTKTIATAQIPSDIKKSLGTIQFEPKSNRFYTNKNIVFYYNPNQQAYVMEKAGEYAVLGSGNEAVLSKTNLDKYNTIATIIDKLNTTIGTQRWDIREAKDTQGNPLKYNGQPVYETNYQGYTLYISKEKNALVYKFPTINDKYKNLDTIKNDLPKILENAKTQERSREVNNRIERNRLREAQKVIDAYNALGFDFELSNKTNPNIINQAAPMQGPLLQSQTTRPVVGQGSLWIQSKKLGYLGIRLDFAAHENHNPNDPTTNPDVLKGIYAGTKETGTPISLEVNLPLQDRAQEGLKKLLNAYYFKNKPEIQILSFNGEGVNPLNKGKVTLKANGEIYHNFPIDQLPITDTDIQDPNAPTQISTLRKQEIQDKKDAYFRAMPTFFEQGGTVTDIFFEDEGNEQGKYVLVNVFDSKIPLRVQYRYQYVKGTEQLKKAPEYTFQKYTVLDGTGPQESTTTLKDLSTIAEGLPKTTELNEELSQFRGDQKETITTLIENSFKDKDALKGFWGFTGRWHKLPRELQSFLHNNTVDQANGTAYIKLTEAILNDRKNLFQEYKRYGFKDKQVVSLRLPLETLARLGDDGLSKIDTSLKLDAAKKLLLNPQLGGSPRTRAENLLKVNHAIDQLNVFLQNPTDQNAKQQIKDLFNEQQWFGARWVSGGVQKVANTATWTGDQIAGLWQKVTKQRQHATMPISTRIDLITNSDLQSALRNGTPGEIRSEMLNIINKVYEKNPIAHYQPEPGSHLRTAYSTYETTAETYDRQNQ